jgi:hypothetical protein
VKASDASGAFNTQTVTVTVNYVPPSVTAPIPDQAATEGTAFAYTVPAGTFADDDALVLSATQPGGAPLPAWLTFDPATGTFTGTPPAGFTTLDVRITASDGTSSAFDVFTIQSPSVALAQASQPSAAQQPASLPTSQAGPAPLPQVGQSSSAAAPSLPADSAPISAGQDSLALRQPVDATVPASSLNPSAPLAPAAFDLNALPATAAGPLEQVGFPLARLGQDEATRALSGDFTRLSLGADRLFVYRGIPDLSFGADGFARVPQDAFAHTDPKAIVQLEARMINGAPLPAWLQFSGTSGLFRGTPPDGFRGTLEILVIARDSEGREARTTFELRVEGLRVDDTQAQGHDAPDIMLGLDVDAKEREKARLEAAKRAGEARHGEKAKPDAKGGKAQKERGASFTDQVKAAKANRDPLLDKISRPDPNGRGKRG